MSFWGLSKTGKDAQGQLGELPRWGKDAMKWNLSRRDDVTQQGTGDVGTFQDFLNNRLQNGFGTPDQIRQWGAAALPNSGPAMDRVRSGYSAVQTPGQTNEQTVNNLDALQDSTNRQVQGNNDINIANFLRSSGRVQDTGNANTALIAKLFPGLMDDVNGTYGGLRDLNNKVAGNLHDLNTNVYSDLRGQNADVLGKLRAQNSGVYKGLTADNDLLMRGLRDQNASTYGDIISKTGNAYRDASTNLERMMPGGDLMAASVARSFAPNVSAVNRRLTAAGIDPNSLEASSVLGDVEAKRGYAMDDLLGKNMSEYIASKNALGIGGADAESRLRREQFGNESTLGQTQGSTDRGLGIDEFGNEAKLAQTQLGNETRLAETQGGNDAGILRDQYGNEVNLAQTQGGLNRGYRQGQEQALVAQNNGTLDRQLPLDTRFGETQLANSDIGYQRTQQIMQQRNQAVQMMRAMGMQDAQIQQQLEQMGLNLDAQQFQMGLTGTGLNVDQQNLGGQGMGSLGEFLLNLGRGYDSSGQNWNQQTFGQYGQDLGVESANAGWGTKLLSGLAGPLLSMIPGVGPFLGAAVSGMGGGGGAGGGGAAGSSLASFLKSILGKGGSSVPWGGYATSPTEDW